jgi:MFS family permease
MPVLEVLRRYPRQLLLAMGVRIAENGAFYIYSVFVLLYATQQVHMERDVVLNAILLGAACELVAIPAFGALSDRIGRRPVYLFGAIATALFAYPLFWLLDTGSPLLVSLALIVAFAISHAAMYAPQGAFLSEMFGANVRYSGASLGSQLASVLAGGLSPFIATALLRHYGHGGPVALYVIVMALITIFAVTLARETSQDEILQ